MQAPARSEAPARDTPQALIDAAIEVFAESGFEGATVKAIAERAGVNISLVSYHFDGKANLFRACLERFAQERLAMSQRFLRPAESADDLRAKLRLMADDFLECHLKQPAAVLVVHREFSSGMVHALDVFRDVFVKCFELMRDFLADAQRKGFVDRSVDPAVMATAFTGAMIHLTRADPIHSLVHGRSLKDPAYRELAVQSVLQIFTQGTRPSTPPSTPLGSSPPRSIPPRSSR